MSFAMSYFTDPMVAQKNKAKNTELSILLHKPAISSSSVTQPNRKQRKDQSQTTVTDHYNIEQSLTTPNIKKPNTHITSHINKPIN
jgi:hypothetical protein